VCEDEFAFAAGSCVSCKDDSAKTSGFAALFLFVVAIAGYGIFASRQKYGVQQRAKGDALRRTAAQGKSWAKTAFKRYKVGGKLVLQYYQMVSMLSVALALPFPPIMSGVANVGGVTNLDVFSFAPTGCAVVMDIHRRMLSYTVVIIVAGLATSVSKSASHFQGFLVAVSFILPSVTRLIFSTFTCVSLDTGESFLIADKSIDCGSSYHEIMVLYGVAMAFLVCAGVPGGCFWLLWKHKHKINPHEDRDEALRIRAEDESLDFIRFMFESYEPECWYWEVVEMVRRIFMTGFLVVLFRGSYSQICICMVITVVAIAYLASRKPFLQLRKEDGEVDEDAPNNNTVALAMMWQTFVTLMLCNVLKGKEDGGWDEGTGMMTKKRLDVMLVCSQFLGLFVLGFKTKRGGGGGGGGLVSVVPVLEEGESLEAKIARLEREKKAAEAREKEALAEKTAEKTKREAVEEELAELKKKN